MLFHRGIIVLLFESGLKLKVDRRYSTLRQTGFPPRLFPSTYECEQACLLFFWTARLILAAAWT